MKPWILDYQLFLFDFDGLLVDTERLHFAAYKQLCARRGCDLDWSFEKYFQTANSKSLGVWDGIEKDFPQILRDGPKKEILYAEKKAIYVEMLQTAELELMQGTQALLEQLADAGIKRAVVTNSPKEHIELIAKKLPLLKTIPHWITREDYSQPKPAPDGYLKAISALASEGDRVVGFEDTLKGLKALIAAGVKPVLICPEHQSHVAECVALGAQHFESFDAIGKI